MPQGFQDGNRLKSLCNPICEKISRGLNRNFVVSLLGLIFLFILVWCFDYIDRCLYKVVLSVPYVALPVCAFVNGMRAKDEQRRFDWLSLGYTVFFFLSLMLAIFSKLERSDLGIYVMSAMVSSPFAVIFVLLTRWRPLLLVGMVPAVILVAAGWIFAALQEGASLHLALPPFLITIFVLIALWTLVVWPVLWMAEKWRKRPALGPFLESLMMFLLFLPTIALFILAPQLFSSIKAWAPVLGAVVGVVFGSVVSVPFRKFLLELWKS